MIGLKAVLFKRVNKSTYEAMHGEAAESGTGGGQRDVRLGQGEPATLIFGEGPEWRGEIHGAGGVSSAAVEANRQEVRRGEWRIQRQTPETDRHPAWGAEGGFPEGLDSEDLPPIVLWLARTEDDEIYAGWLDEDGIESLPDPLREWAEGTSDRSTTAGGRVQSWSDGSIPGQVLEALQRRPCVLLYGPPGTGKTYVMQELEEHIGSSAFDAKVILDPEDEEVPFKHQRAASFPGDVKSWWMTFHQSTTYENTVVGLRPQPAGGGVEFQPRAGPLLEALEHARGGNTSLLFIDEINRGNVARILGDFITFMEYDKRLLPDGSEHGQSIPLTFPMIDVEDSDGGTSEEIEFGGAGQATIEFPYHVPYHVYIVATMNSLDRSVAPLDTALARRFARIEVPVDYEVLDAQLTTTVGDEVSEIAVELLRKVNESVRTNFGPDFQLGHAYLWPPDGGVEEPFSWMAQEWDWGILPQLRELFRNQPMGLVELLVPDGAEAWWPYSKERGRKGQAALQVERQLRHLSDERKERVFRRLAGVARRTEPDVEEGEEEVADVAEPEGPRADPGEE